MARVSIVVPTYNRAPRLGRALDSALGQSHPGCEVVVVDDGSTDQTAAVVAGYGPRIVPVAGNHRGRSAARNAGARRARGEFLVFLDDDDQLLPHMVATQLAALERHPGWAFVHAFAWMTDDQGQRVEPPILMGAPFEAGRSAFASIVLGNPLLIGTVLVRKDAFDAVGGFDEQLQVDEDWDLWLRLTARGDAGFNPVPVYLVATDRARYVERLRRYQVQVETPRVIERAFGYLAPEAPERALRSKAVARAHVQWGACVEAAGGNWPAAHDHWRMALAAQPDLLRADDLESVPRGVAQFATWFVLDGAAFIRRLFAHLPPEAAGRGSAWRAQTLAIFHAKQAQLAWAQRRAAPTLAHVVAAATASPRTTWWAARQYLARSGRAPVAAGDDPPAR